MVERGFAMLFAPGALVIPTMVVIWINCYVKRIMQGRIKHNLALCCYHRLRTLDFYQLIAGLVGLVVKLHAFLLHKKSE